jgi:predicted small secreted protein
LKGDFKMKINQLLIGVGIGAAAGFFLSSKLNEKGMSPEKALKLVKDKVKENIPVDGSWIHMQPEELAKNELTYEVYRGGLTATQDNTVDHYDFVVDAKTGAVIELNKQS